MNLKAGETLLSQSPLGKKSSYIQTYTPSLLFPIPRKTKRDEIGISLPLPFKGLDIWNGFELSWLNLKGKPIVACAEFRIPCESPNIIESKSFKLYLNSLNHSKFSSFDEVRVALETDLSKCVGATVQTKLYPMHEANMKISDFQGICLDHLDIDCVTYQPEVDFLTVSDTYVQETLYSHLLKSNCLVTGQPDWGSIVIEYEGQKINHEGLLKYIISFRDHNEFHEQCVERIFNDILRKCKPKLLTVYARYTRRGGLDINPFRTNKEQYNSVENMRLVRQ